MKWNYIWNHWNSSFSFIELTKKWLDIDKEEFSMFLPVLANIGKIGRVVVPHFIFYKVLLRHWEMTLIVLTAKWNLYFIEIDKSIFNTGSNIVIRIIYRMPIFSVYFLIIVYLTYKILYITSINIVTSWETWILISWNLNTIEPRENYLMYYIAAMYSFDHETY